MRIFTSTQDGQTRALVQDDAGAVWSVPQYGGLTPQGTQMLAALDPTPPCVPPPPVPERAAFLLDDWAVTLPGFGLDRDGNAEWRGTVAEFMAQPGVQSRLAQIYGDATRAFGTLNGSTVDGDLVLNAASIVTTVAA